MNCPICKKFMEAPVLSAMPTNLTREWLESRLAIAIELHLLGMGADFRLLQLLRDLIQEQRGSEPAEDAHAQ